MPGLVTRVEPLAPGEAHVDPADPRGLRRGADASGAWGWRARAVAPVAGALAVLAVVVAVDRGSWWPLGAAALSLLAAFAASDTLARFDRSARDRRASARVAGGLGVALVLLLASTVFYAR